MLDEGNYLYPLPGEAVFSDFSLWQGDRELKGEPMDFFFTSRIRHTICGRDWSSDVCSSDLISSAFSRSRCSAMTFSRNTASARAISSMVWPGIGSGRKPTK